MDEAVPHTPKPVQGLYDRPMWESISARRMTLQRCSECGAFRYPPGPICPECLSEACDWTAVSGRGTIVSWVVFHRGYLPAYPPPYNAIAVRLAEGPIMISNLDGPAPRGSWIDTPVEMTYVTMKDGFVLPRFVVADQGSGGGAA